jgi:hypothetical protein
VTQDDGEGACKCDEPATSALCCVSMAGELIMRGERASQPTGRPSLPIEEANHDHQSQECEDSPEGHGS